MHAKHVQAFLLLMQEHRRLLLLFSTIFDINNKTIIF